MVSGVADRLLIHTIPNDDDDESLSRHSDRNRSTQSGGCGRSKSGSQTWSKSLCELVEQHEFDEVINKRWKSIISSKQVSDFD